jgi:Fe-S-cluster-containing dehydrogenase component
MKTWHLIIDVARCEDCNNCLLACKDEHAGNEWPGYAVEQPRHGQRWMDVVRIERGQYPLVDVVYRPTTCMHCADAPCIEASAGAVYRRKDGIVLIDPERAKGKRELVDSCPYHAIWWNEERQTAQKCTLCAHLIDQGWKQPRCVQACPTGALRVEFVDEPEMARMVEAEKLEVLHAEYGTRPTVYYADLRRFDSCFIAGSVAVEKNQVIDCAAGAAVILFRDNRRIADTLTDAFGDFRFDGLASNSNEYRIDIAMEGFEANSSYLQRLDQSVNLGVILLSPFHL